MIGETPPEEAPPEAGEGPPPEAAGPSAPSEALPDASDQDIKRYGLDIQDYAKDSDEEDIDWSEV